MTLLNKIEQSRLIVLLVFIFLILLCFRPLSAVGQTNQNRRLSFYNTHTQERLTVVYKMGEQYSANALKKINYILRDHRSGKLHRMDPKLIDFLYDLLVEVDNVGEVHIISGYRSPETNAKLHRKSKGVAKRSLHMQGKALDFRLPGTDTVLLRDTARAMKRGGVGYYKKSDFIQIDTGRVRYW